MGISERKGRQRAKLRGQILEAARAIIVRDGLDALTIRKIAEAIEYAAGTIYLHFQSRDEIAAALVRDGFDALLAALAPAADELDALVRVREFGRRYIAFAREQPETYRLIFMEDDRFARLIATVVAEARDVDAFALLLAAVQELIDDGRFQKRDPRLVASLLWAGLHGIAALALSCSDFAFPEGIEAPGALMIEALERGFAARPGPTP